MDLRRENSDSYYRQKRHMLFTSWSRVGHPLRQIFRLWLIKIWELISCGKIYEASGNVFTDSWSWKTFVSSCDVFKCLSPPDIQNEIQLLSRFFCYSWLVCLLGFWLRNAPLVQVIGNPISDGIVFVFHLAWCVRWLKSLKGFWPYLMVFRSCISTGKPE